MAIPQKLSREELYELVWSEPISKIAPRLGLSDRGLKKICARNQIPTPGRGYWQRVRHGQRPRRAKLKELPDQERDNPIRVGPSPASPTREPETGPVADQKRFEALDENRIHVGETLRGCHPLITQTKKALKQRGSTGYRWRLKDVEALHIRVSSGSQRRALLLMNSLLKALDQRGFRTYLEKRHSEVETIVSVHGEEVRISLTEPRTKVEVDLPPDDWRLNWRDDPVYDLEPSGRLVFRIEDYSAKGARRSWSDGKRQRLEKLLNEIVVGLVAASVKIRERRLEREERERKWEQERRRRQVIELQRQLEQKRVDELDRQVAAWIRRGRIQAYLSQIRRNREPATAPSGPGLPSDEWIKWIEEHLAMTPPDDK